MRSQVSCQNRRSADNAAALRASAGVEGCPCLINSICWASSFNEPSPAQGVLLSFVAGGLVTSSAISPQDNNRGFVWELRRVRRSLRSALAMQCRDTTANLPVAYGAASRNRNISSRLDGSPRGHNQKDGLKCLS